MAIAYNHVPPLGVTAGQKAAPIMTGLPILMGVQGGVGAQIGVRLYSTGASGDSNSLSHQYRYSWQTSTSEAGPYTQVGTSYEYYPTLADGGKYITHTKEVYNARGSAYATTAARLIAPAALGGTLYSDTTYYYRKYTSNGSAQFAQALVCDILVVAGGGGGSKTDRGGGGGGAGGVVAYTNQTIAEGSYNLIVGIGGPAGPNWYTRGQSGNPSRFGTLTQAIGGGSGGSGYYNAATVGSRTGGSGGGNGHNPNVNQTGASAGGSGTAGQGSSGGIGIDNGSSNFSGGGGGGAGGAGIAGSSNSAGGIGATFDTLIGGTTGPYSFINAMGAATSTGQLSGGNYYFAGGGGGGRQVGSTGASATYGPAGLGGGGSGASSNGTPNTGGGGSGACGVSTGGGETTPGAGGSGVIIIRYTRSQVGG